MAGDAMLVVAGALLGEDGRWLMHRRPFDKHHGGLWEFPGGKVEVSEIPVKALIRELHEELGIEIEAADCEPFCFAENSPENGNPHIVILLYILRRWSGSPQALEGGELGWFTPAETDSLAKPPLDEVLTARLFAPGAEG
ncbi:hypothetical protein AUC45_01025 [Erythrobacter sp. YT30]|nr:hypothetical protein AUC45_01025 [Erythrobacter sp. YT30]